MASAAVLSPSLVPEFMLASDRPEIIAAQAKLSSEKIAALLATQAPEEFNAKTHLAYAGPDRRFSMSEMGLDPADTSNNSHAPAILDFAYTAPFRLLSDEGVEAMRKAVFSNEVLSNCPFKVKDAEGSDYTHWELRNTSKHSSFIKDFWTSDAVGAAVNDALQYDVTPTMDVELGHVNLQTPVMSQVENGVTGWHRDGNCQFVCIVMLSDSRNMVGGETAFRKADGSVALIRYPAAGYAICMQGLNILHSVTDVLEAEGERMTMVTSYQPKSHKAAQNGRIKYLFPLGTDADRIEMAADYTSWRLEVLSKRLADMAAKVKEDRKQDKFNLEDVQAGAADFSEFLKITVDEVDGGLQLYKENP